MRRPWRGPTCFISRVYTEEANMQLFVNTLYKHLNLAGVQTILDINDLQIGENIDVFIQRINNSKFTIAIFTPSYKQRARYTDTWIYEEMSAIDSKIKRGNLRFYVPILLKGDAYESIPVILNPKGNLYADFRNESWYMRNLLALLDQKILFSFRNPLDGMPSNINAYQRNFSIIQENADKITENFIRKCESAEEVGIQFDQIRRVPKNNIELNQRSNFMGCFCRLLTYALSLSVVTTQKMFEGVNVKSYVSTTGTGLATLPFMQNEAYSNSYIHLQEDELTEDDLPFIKQTADQGDPSAQFEFATLSKKRGNKSESDMEKYITYITFSADNGYTSAQFELATLYENGNEFIERNKEKFMHYLKLAAENGHKIARRKFEKLSQEEKCGGQLGVRTFIRNLHQQAEDRNIFAMYRLSQIYQFGECLVVEDRQQYFKYLKLSAEGGSDDAQFEIAMLYKNATSDLVQKDDNKVFYYLTRAADGGHIPSTFMLVDLYAERRDTYNLIKYLKLLSNNGYSFGQYRLAKIYENGMHVIGGHDLGRNTKLYRDYLTLVANNRYEENAPHIINAQYELAKLYENGRDDVKGDMALFEEYLKRSANSGHKVAPYELAKLYENGRDQIKKNAIDYKRYLVMAASRGHESAKRELSILSK